MLASLDTETTGLDIFHGCRPFYVSACDEAGNVFAWEWDVDPLTRTPIPPKEDIAEISDFIARHTIVYHNAKFDQRALQAVGVTIAPWDRIEETVIASHCLASAESHKLKDLALQYLDINDDDETDLKAAVNEARRIARKDFPEWRIAGPDNPQTPGLKRAPKAGWGVMDYWLPRAVAKAKGYPAEHPYWTVLSRYAGLDAERTMGLWLVFREALEAEGLYQQYETRKKLLPITYDMETRGVTLSRRKLEAAIEKYKDLAISAEVSAKRLADNKIDNLNSHKQLQGILYGHFKIKPTKATKQGYATDKETLTAIQDTLPQRSKAYHFIKQLTHCRQLEKAVDYLESYKAFSLPYASRRQPISRRGQHWTHVAEWLVVHPNFNPTGTKTTRLSSDNPNQQNVSKKESLNLREVFGPTPGREWWSLDYSNIELRIFAYASGDKRLIEAFESGYSVHLIICEILHPKEFAECERTGEVFKDKYESTLYQWAKNGTFSLIYGASPEKANRTYRVPDAYERIRKRLPLIDKFIETKNKEARKHGYITTLGGYRLQVPKEEPHKSANYFVQGSAGWAMILALIRVYEYLQTLGAGYYLNMSIHDEIDLDFPSDPGNVAIASEVKRLMELSGEALGLPTPVDVERITDTWAKGERIKFAT